MAENTVKNDTAPVGTKIPPHPKFIERILPILTFFGTLIIISLLLEREDYTKYKESY